MVLLMRELCRNLLKILINKMMRGETVNRKLMPVMLFAIEVVMYYFICLYFHMDTKLIINRKRPIQKYNIKPVDDLKRRNYSFPSIQVAFATSVALTVLRYGPNMGLLLSTLAVALTISRFLSGVHYLSDVIVSICIAFAINMIFI